MTLKYDVTALGEALIDFVAVDKSESGAALFEQNPGGAPLNVLAAIDRLCGSTAFIGKVGDDLQGRFIRDVMENLAIETKGLVLDPDYTTTMTFVSLDDDGERHFSFARKPGADTQLKKEEVDFDLIRNSKIFHFGSLSLTDEPAREATLCAVDEARKAGVLVSYDPNYRAPLWPDVETAKAQIRMPVPKVDIMKISEEECELLTDKKRPEDAAEVLLSQGVRCVFVTLGADGAMVKTKDFSAFAPAMNVYAVDTTGAGDAFWGAILYQIANQGLDSLNPDNSKRILRFANIVGGLCVEKRGGVSSMPSITDIQDVLGW
ncbi:MAG: carbohydrate kinase [Pseudoramibacter sp.]|nr:carbohydrate kinase [Pseudoramibacter sp.]MCH4071512.1 carbohydrate kinase [Pseudoramibacter sp.]MCH4105280.1 carbohydrate kinase [Pseudoramibacter sp.]